MSNSNPFSYTLAKIQQLQDMFSHHFQVSITIHTKDGTPITIPSNQDGICYNKQMNSDSLCCSFYNQIQEQVSDKLIVMSCPYQCSFAIAPLGGSLATYNKKEAEYFIMITQKNQESTEGIFSNFQLDPFLSMNSLPSSQTKFHEIAQLISFTFNTAFSLMQADKMELNLNIPDNFRKEGFNSLTTREKEILHQVSIGMSNQQISTNLFISEHTVKAHISNILKKLGLSNRTQLAIYEIQSL